MPGRLLLPPLLLRWSFGDHGGYWFAGVSVLIVFGIIVMIVVMGRMNDDPPDLLL